VDRTYDILIVGAGILGAVAAMELYRRGYRVGVLDPGPLPHPLAASTDISKVLRIEYGGDALYEDLVEQARRGWLDWNANLLDEPLYHEVGVVMLCRGPMAPGGYEYENYHSLLRRGYQPERLDQAAIARRFPIWNAKHYTDGYTHPFGGYIESGRAVTNLLRLAERSGVELLAGMQVTAIREHDGVVTGVTTQAGDQLHAPRVLVAAGAWTPSLIPDLAPVMRVTGHPVFHLKPLRPERFAFPQFCVFSADSATTGWYGFPLHPRAQVVKIARHGVGLPVDPNQPIPDVTAEERAEFRRFLALTFPELLDAPIVFTRRCLYNDTPDEHFWIDAHPQPEGLSIAAGDSGHALKFAPVLGPLIADMVEGKRPPAGERFRRRSFAQVTTGAEASRFRGAQ
jgi:sarcosine oxidase / L-pipecolate oxidase